MKKSSVKLEIKLHPPQRAALYSPAEQTLYGGAAGGGKSYLLRAAAVTWCLAVPKFTFYLFRRTYGDLIANHFEGYMNFHEMLAPLIEAGQCRILQKSIRFANGSRIILAHLSHVNDLVKYQGRQIHGLGIDEATHFNEREIRFLFSRMRLGGLKIPADCPWTFPRAILATNPGGIGHLWAKKWFVDHGAFTVFRSNAKNGSKLRTFIPAKLSDNPTMTETDPEYASSLRGLGDPLLVRAMLEGDWKIVAGAMFGGVWRDSLHTCDSFAIPPDWEMWRGADDGYGSPAAVYWLTEDPRDKTIYIAEELHRAGMLPAVMAAEIKQKDKGIILWDQEQGRAFLNPEADFDGLLDSAAFSDSGQGNIARGLQLRKLGIRFKPTKKWTGSRVHRAQNLHRLLAVNPKTGKPGIIFFKRCVKAIETIPALPRDKNNPEDVDTNGDDHCLVAGTMIATEYGERPIETIKPGEMVWTRAGLRPVLLAHPEREVDVFTLATDEGVTITGSGNHPIWTVENGWIDLANMTPSVTVLRWTTPPSSAPRSRPFEERAITFAIGTFSAMASDCIALFGRLLMAPFQKTWRFITGTKTEATTRSTTWNSWRQEITSGTTGRSQRPSNEKPEESTQRLHNEAMQRSHQSSEAMRQAWAGRRSKRPTLSVKSAAECSVPADQPLPEFAAVPVLKRSCVASVEMSGKALVYNLTVEGEHEYFANGIVVHNSYDAVTYGLQWKGHTFTRRRVST